MVPEPTTEERVTDLRRSVKAVADHVLVFSKELKMQPRSADAVQAELDGEMIANTILTFRHLEDAAMRLGKVLQANNGGVSKYDDGGVPKQA